jgi:uncharacterized protein YbaR (Trm112 family)
MSAIPSEIRAVLACPRCRGPLDDAGTLSAPSLRCEACALAYPVEQGIPVLLAERAEPSRTRAAT